MNPAPPPMAPTPDPGTRRRAFASPKLIRRLAGLLLWIGVIGALWGVTYDINGATQAGADVEVGVQVRAAAALEVSAGNKSDEDASILVRQETDYGSVLTSDSGLGVGLPLGIPGVDAARVLLPNDGVQLIAGNSTVAEQLLSRGHLAVLGLCLLGGAVLLRRVLISVNEGRPFQPGNAGRIAGLAGLLIITAAGEFLPFLGSNLVLARLGLDGIDSPLVAASPELPLISIVIVLLLLALAEAFRRGADMAQDIDGLV